jgi:hypothetical protein
MHTILFLKFGIDAGAWTFGDDVVVAVYDSPYGREETLRIYERGFYSLFGLEVKASDTYVTEKLCVAGALPASGLSVKFLSNFFVETPFGVMPAPDFAGTVENMLYPENNPIVNSPEMSEDELIIWELARTTSCYLVSYWNPEIRAMMEHYATWLRGKLSEEVTFEPLFWANAFKAWDVPPYVLSERWVGSLPGFGEIFTLYRTSSGEGRLRTAAFLTRLAQMAGSEQFRDDG